MMGPAVLITIGTLFLIGEFSHFDFGRSWPVLLLVIGIVKLLQYTAPIEGHRPTQVYMGAPVVTPPPAPPAGNLPEEHRGESSGEGVQNV